MNIGIAGIYAATNRFEASAQRTANGTGDLAAEAVEQASAKAALDASAVVVRTSEQMSKRLLDIRV